MTLCEGHYIRAVKCPVSPDEGRKGARPELGLSVSHRSGGKCVNACVVVYECAGGV